MEQNESLVKANTGLEHYKVKVNPLVLVQTNHISKWPDAKPGHYRDTLANKEFEKPIKLVPLSYSPQRLYFPTTELGGKPLCKSVNGVKPLTKAEGKVLRLELEPQSNLCDTCAWGGKKRWNEYFNPKSPKFRKAPECKERPQLVFLDVETELPYVISFSTKSIKYVKNFIDAVTRELQSKQNFNKLLPCDFVTEMYSAQEVDKKGAYHIAQFSSPKKIDTIGQYYQQFQDYVVNPNAEVIEKNVDEAVDGEIIEA